MPKMNKKTMIIIGAGVAAVLLVMYLRSRSASSTSPTDTLGTTDANGDPSGSGYADLGGQLQQSDANEASDVASLSGQLQAAQAQEASDIAGLNAQFAGLSAIGADPTSPSGPVTNPTSPQPRMSVLTRAAKAAGVIAAPFGAKAPTGTPAGYKDVGLGGGNWGYAPTTNRRPAQHQKTGQTKTRPVTNHQNGNHPAGTAGHAVAPRSHAPARAPTVGARLSGLHPVIAQPVHPKPAPQKASKPAQRKVPAPRKPVKARKK